MTGSLQGDNIMKLSLSAEQVMTYCQALVPNPWVPNPNPVQPSSNPKRAQRGQKGRDKMDIVHMVDIMYMVDIM